LTRDEFDRRIAAGEFLEWADYNRHRYGTLKAPMDRALAAGRVFVLEIEVQGTRQLRARSVPGIYIFLVPPSLDVLRERLAARGANSPQEIEARMRIATEELRARDLYDHVVVNDRIETTVQQVKELIGL
jgi:guanylate kinase